MGIISVYKPSAKRALEVARSVMQRKWEDIPLFRSYYSVRREVYPPTDAAEELENYRIYLNAALTEIDKLERSNASLKKKLAKLSSK